ncbi:hypothetical protein [Atopobium sp. oral taxon 199]|uniref:nSTAND3 domain-containing NTPase n=1 Tax=Atopobium sp. oral taxon 199 TaxID=712156 RepID=UPI00034E8731|nr:hypothetical protein [Atopobium sp. oral taxon 199]EPD77479.1 hypothetical protein HMPREF1527_01412 [Atopobium sp. oral taxon 199 str. F0494]
MSRINQIEEELRQIEGGRFQTLANQYLCRRYSLGNCVHYGSNFGTDKTTTGVPDMYSVEDNKFFFAAFTSSTSDIRKKLLADAHNCLDESKTHIDSSLIDRIVLCHTTPRLDPSITAEVLNIDSRIEIIGPEAIAEDLDKKYAPLAFLTLGIPLGKGSFISPEAFVKRNSQGRFTTDQSKPLLYRDDDMSDIIKSINQNKAVLIYGQSGCGKTRIALEACRKFSEEKSWGFLVLDSKYSDSIDEDIELILTESESLIILVDDANNQVSLDHLLSVCAGNDNLKIVFTCRKMYRNELVAMIETRLKHVDIELAPLAPEKINIVLENEYGTINRSFRERVTAIANGNLRLAIMAAISLTEGNREAVREPYDLLKFYMDSALDKYTNRERLLIEVVAIYDGLDIVEGDPCYEKLLKMGYNKIEIEETISKLAEQEIVTTLLSPDKELSVRMEEQNLQDFLICHHFAKANHGSYADFIVSTSEMPRASYLKAAKSMVEVCGSESVNSYIRKECEEAWNILERGNRRAANQFLTAFNQFIPVKALAYVAKHIEGSSRADISEEALGESVTSDDSVVLSILVSLMNLEEYSDMALDLFVQCVEKGTEQLSQYRWACGANNAFSCNIKNGEFKIENKKLDVLVDEYHKTGSCNIAVCLIFLTEAYLASRAERVSLDGTTYTISALSYNFTPELANLHAKCFRALSNLLGTEYEERVKSNFRQRFSFYGEKPGAKHAKGMNEVLSKIEDFIPLYIDEDSTSDLSCSLCINKIYEACGQNPLLNLKKFSQATFDALGCENAFSSVEKGYKTLPKDLSYERLEGVLPKLVEDSLLLEKQWDANQAIENVLLEIANRKPNAALKIIAEFMKSLGDAHVVPNAALSYLASTIGAKNLRKELSKALDINAYPALFDSLDLLVINEGLDNQVLDELLARLEDGRYHFDLTTLEKIELEHPGYTLLYTTKFSESVKDFSNVWRFFGSKNEKHISALTNSFSSNPSPIVDLYFRAMEGFSHFDYDLSFLRCIVQINPSVKNRFIEYSSKLDFDVWHELMQRISVFWTESDGIAWQLLKSCIDDVLNKPLKRFELSSLFPIHNAAAFSDDVFWCRFESLVVENRTGIENLYAISWAMSECNDQTRIRALSYILTLDEEGSTIGHLSLRRSSMSGSFEVGFIPTKQREIDVLKAIEQQLPAGVSYLKHREWLAKTIEYIETEIKKEKWDLFHGRH